MNVSVSDSRPLPPTKSALNSMSLAFPCFSHFSLSPVLFFRVIIQSLVSTPHQSTPTPPGPFEILRLWKFPKWWRNSRSFSSLGLQEITGDPDLMKTLVRMFRMGRIYCVSTCFFTFQQKVYSVDSANPANVFGSTSMLFRPSLMVSSPVDPAADAVEFEVPVAHKFTKFRRFEWKGFAVGICSCIL